MEHSLSLCAQEIKQTNHDQFLCGLFVEDDFRETFYALQYFHQEIGNIRNLVNEPQLGLIRLQWWRDLIDGAEPSGLQGTHQEILKSFQKSSLNSSIFDAYFNARIFDMEDQPHDDLEALKRYGRATAGLIAKRQANSTNAELLKACELIGEAITLTQLIQTIPHQLQTQRCMIPRSLIQKFEINLSNGETENLRNCVEYLAKDIHEALKTARQFKGTNAALLSAISIDDYLYRLKKCDYSPFSPNIGGGRLKRQVTMAFRTFRNRF